MIKILINRLKNDFILKKLFLVIIKANNKLILIVEKIYKVLCRIHAEVD